MISFILNKRTDRTEQWHTLGPRLQNVLIGSEGTGEEMKIKPMVTIRSVERVMSPFAGNWDPVIFLHQCHNFNTIVTILNYNKNQQNKMKAYLMIKMPLHLFMKRQLQI